jgi:hypothetical protein
MIEKLKQTLTDIQSFANFYLHSYSSRKNYYLSSLLIENNTAAPID